MSNVSGLSPRVICVLNLQAGNGSLARRWPLLARRLAAEGYRFDLVDIAADSLAATLARLLAAGPCAAVIGIGGDGTHRSVINALKACAASLPTLAIPPYLPAPFGTGNNLAKSLGYRPCRDRWDELLSALRDGLAQPLDLGRFERNYFADAVSIGLDAEILERRNRLQRRLPADWGRLRQGYPAYAAAGLSALLVRPRHQCEISLDGKPWYCGPFTGILVNDTRVYGGVFEPTPEACHDDGFLDVVVIHSRFSYLANGLLSLRFQPTVVKRQLGRRTGWLGIRHGRCRACRIGLEPPAPLQVDGEWVGLRHDIPLEIEQHAIQVLTPSPLHRR